MLPNLSTLLVQVAFLPISHRQSVLRLFALHAVAPEEQRWGVALTGGDTPASVWGAVCFIAFHKTPVHGDHVSRGRGGGLICKWFAFYDHF